LLDGALFPSLDALVQIFEGPAQMAAQGRTHTAFARAHKTYQDDGPNP
jgi:hypothetical protein